MKSISTLNPTLSSNNDQFLVCSGGAISYSKISTNDIVIAEPFKAEIAKLVKEEVEKVCYELYVAGSLPLTEQAKEYFAKKL